MNPPTMRVKIHAPSKIYFDGEASSLSAVNETGPFDILPRHKKFMTLLSAGRVIVRAPNKQDSQFQIGGGVMHVKADKTTIFLDV